jgi:hypothetical protein
LLSAKKTQPGKSGQIRVEIKTANLIGSLEKRIHLKTNDPRNRELTLTVRASVKPEISLSEHSIFFGNVPGGREVRREIVLTLPADKRIRILGAETTDPRVRVKLEPVPGSNPPQWKLIAVRKADEQPGYHFGEIVVKTDSLLNPKLVVYERGTVTDSGK